MKLKICLILTSAILLIKFALCGIPASAIQTSSDRTSHITTLNGSFIQPWLYVNWDDARWKSEMEVLKETGIDTLIMGDVANQNPDDSWTVFYPSELDFLDGYFAYDAVEQILHYCELYDIKLYLGMGLDTNWNSDLTTAEGRAANAQYMEHCNRITTELYEKYKAAYPNTYYGFYFVTELYNTHYMETDYGTTLYTDGLQDMFTTVLDNCNKLNPDMPILFSPYVNIFGYGYASINFDRFTEFWTQALTKIPFRNGDMICPQDSCGGGGNDPDHLAEWTAAYRSAVDRSNAARGTKLLLGTNAEMFVQPDAVRMARPHGIDYTGTKTVDDFSVRLELAAPYVDALFCFAYSHHYSPDNAVPGFHKAFVQYLKNGTIEANPPTPPDTIRTETVNTEGTQYLQLSFSGMTDDTDVGQINIYKNGVFYDYLVAGVNNGKTGNNHVQNTWIDYDFNVTSDTAVYELEAVDVCGNVSEKRGYTVTEQNVNNGINIETDNPNMEKERIWEKNSLDYLSYTVTDAGIRITDCDPSAVSIEIPDIIEGKPVTVIDWYAFENCKHLKSVTIPETVTHISRFAFVHCISLETVNMPSSLYAIEQYAFFDCPLLKNVTLPNGLAIIEERAFSGCDTLTELTIPASCQQVGDYAFFDCNALQMIAISGKDTAFGNRCIGYGYNNGYQIQSLLIMDASKNSTAERYANENGIRLKSELLMGDVNQDGEVSIADAVMLQKWLLNTSKLTEWRAGDLDGNNIIDLFDLFLLKNQLISK